MTAFSCALLIVMSFRLIGSILANPLPKRFILLFTVFATFAVYKGSLAGGLIVLVMDLLNVPPVFAVEFFDEISWVPDVS